MKTAYIIITSALLVGASLAMITKTEQEAPKQAPWGHALKGVAISVQPGKSQYRLGEKIKIPVIIKNIGEDEAMVFTEGGFLDNYRLALFDTEGRPVASTRRVRKFEDRFRLEKRGGIITSISGTDLKAGETIEQFQSFTLNEWFKLEKEGTFFLVVMRRLWAWDKGFLISNMAKINIGNESEKDSPTFSRPEERGEDFSLLATSEVVRRLGTSEDMIERRKAAKVLGDRNISGMLNLSGEEKKAIQRIVGDCLEQVKASDDSNVREEARQQIERMWRIAIPTLLENVGSRNTPIAETAIKSLILMRDESIVKALIEKAQSEEDEHTKARLIFTLKKMTEQRTSLMPGRKCLNEEESAELYDRLIAPALASLTMHSVGAREATAEGVHLHGVMTVDGKMPGKDVEANMLVIEGGRRGYNAEVAYLHLDEQGRFSQILDAAPGKELFIIPKNLAWLARGHLLYGFAMFRAEKDVFVEVNLFKRTTETRPVRVVDDTANPAAHSGIGCRSGIPLGNAKGDPSWWGQQTAPTDVNGFAQIHIVKGGLGEYLLRAHSPLPDSNDRYVGELEVPGARFAAADDKSPILFKVHRLRVSLRVVVKWDAKYSSEEFFQDVGLAMASHTLILNNDHRTGTLMDKNGVTLFYDLKAGQYNVSFTKYGKERYTITGGNEIVTIPKVYEKAVERTITVVPTQKFDVSGIVVDEETRQPVTGARVVLAGRSVRTGKDGNFAFEAHKHMEARLEISHREYFQKSLSIELKEGAAPLVAAIKAYPQCYGNITTGKAKKATAGAKLRFEGKSRTFSSRSNENGEYSLTIAPGIYRLVVKVPVTGWAAEAIKTEGKVKPARIYDEAFVMPDASHRLNIETGGIGAAVIEVSHDDPAAQTPAHGAALLRWRDSRLVASGKLHNNQCLLNAVEGKYRIIVFVDDDTGADGGSIELVDGKVVRSKVHVSTWSKIRIVNGSVEFLQAKRPAAQ